MDFEEDNIEIEQTLEDWVMDKVDTWRDHFETNYSEIFDEYYRLWRGQWAPEDRTRESERSRIISPALQQAVESSVAEIEEATFGHGTFFDIEDDEQDEERQDIGYLRRQLTKDFSKTKVRKGVAECLINAAVFGTGIGEIVLGEEKEYIPSTEDIMDGSLKAIGVRTKTRVTVRLRPIMPKNFLIDPLAVSIDEALGVAIDEFVSAHQVEMLQEQGVYKDVSLEVAADDFDIEPDDDITTVKTDKVRLTRYYGLVPRALLTESEEYEEDDDLPKTQYVEAIVVIANKGVLLKAEHNPYMMQDRPVIAFPWDVVPSKFWGRGVCEKGYNSQKALDTELRARIDALGLAVHPMMAMDATRIPRGTRPEVRPGKLLLTNGNPAEILHPFHFGQVDQITFAQAAALQTMVQQSTGAIDSAGIAGSVNGEGTAAGISMSLGAIIKRHKRTLINFQESFLLPFVYKAAWRYMQFEPDLYPVDDYKFHATSSLGIIAREYEVGQLVQLLQTIPADNPVYPIILESIIEHMNVSNREDIIAALQAAGQPDPAQQEREQAAYEMEAAIKQAQAAALNGEASASTARAKKTDVEAQLLPQETEIKKIEAITRNLREGEGDDQEFERRLKVADIALKERKLDLNEKDTNIKGMAVATQSAANLQSIGRQAREGRSQEGQPQQGQPQNSQQR